jgi:hypothetical protein
MRKIKENCERCRFNVVEKRSKARRHDTAYRKAERIMKNGREFAQLFFDEKGTAAIEFGLIGTFVFVDDWFGRFRHGLLGADAGWQCRQGGHGIRNSQQLVVERVRDPKRGNRRHEPRLHHGHGVDAKLRVPQRVWRHYGGGRDNPDLRCELHERRDVRRLCHRQCAGALFDHLALSGTS